MKRTVLFALFLAACPYCTPSSLRADPPPEVVQQLPEKLPLSGLTPSKLFPDLCLLRYRVSTTSPECQTFFNQGLGFHYSYVYLEAVRSFETATQYDPGCAMAWLGLSRSLYRQRKNDQHLQALKKAQELMGSASDRERLLIQARLQEFGLWPDSPKESEKRVAAAAKTVDELLAVYDDEEAWYYRAHLANNGKLHGGTAAGVPYYKALLRLNPVHPAANHELVHFYETFRRPALGWPYAEKYIESSPGIPHAWHMQAHLATRIGRWDKTTDRSVKAVELERAYHKLQGVAPRQDDQYSHHLEVLTSSLIHDGRFAEAHKVRQEAQKHGYRHTWPWFQLWLAERNYDEALKVVEEYLKKDKNLQAYTRAKIHLAKDELDQAAAQVESLEQAAEKNPKDKPLERRSREVRAVLQCRRGEADRGLGQLKELADWAASDYGSHSWGSGAYYMETWGQEALRAGRPEVAEEAFLEALAHDPGSVRGALGMQVLCEAQGRDAEAARFAELARRCWDRAATDSLVAELSEMRRLAAHAAAAEAPAAAEKTPTPK